MSLAVLANIGSAVPALEPEHPNDAGNRIPIRHGLLVRDALQAAALHAIVNRSAKNLAMTRSITITMPKKHLEEL